MVEQAGQVIAADGYSISYRVWPSEGTEERAVVLLLNGMMSHSGWFFPILERLGGAGFKMVGADRRGSGPNREGLGDTPSARILLDDVVRILDAESVGAKNVFVLGWCWGAVLAVNLAADFPRRFRGLILAAPGLFPTAGVSEAMAAELEGARACPEDEPVLASPIADEMFTSGKHLAGFIKNDTARVTHFTRRFQRAMVQLGLRARSKLSRLELPVSLLLGEWDRATDNAATVAAFERMASPPEIHTLPGAHGIHFDASEEFAQHIIDFVTRHAHVRSS